jgi:hypothetical protein
MREICFLCITALLYLLLHIIYFTTSSCALSILAASSAHTWVRFITFFIPAIFALGIKVSTLSLFEVNTLPWVIFHRRYSARRTGEASFSFLGALLEVVTFRRSW